MKNRGVSCGKYRLCGFLNLQPFFPAFVYPVFCRSDSKHNVHYFFEDGKKSTIQMFHEIDFKTFPELITPSNLGHYNYTVGSETVYAYALSPEHVVWGDFLDFIPLLKSVLPMLQSHAQKKSAKEPLNKSVNSSDEMKAEQNIRSSRQLQAQSAGFFH